MKKNLKEDQNISKRLRAWRREDLSEQPFGILHTNSHTIYPLFSDKSKNN